MSVGNIYREVVADDFIFMWILFLCGLVDSGRLLLPRPRHVQCACLCSWRAPKKKWISTYHHRRNCTTVFFSIIYCSWRDILILSLSLKTQIFFLFFSISCASSIRNSNIIVHMVFGIYIRSSTSYSYFVPTLSLLFRSLIVRVSSVRSALRTYIVVNTAYRQYVFIKKNSRFRKCTNNLT